MYLKSQSVKGNKVYTKKDLSKGSVSIFNDSEVNVNWNSYTKRSKIYGNGLWIDTKPLVVNTIDKSITIWEPKPLEIVNYINKIN